MRHQNTGGNWSVHEVTYHINIKEMLAVKFALKSFAKEFSIVSINKKFASCLADFGSSGDGGLSEFKTVKRKICDKNLF